MQKIDFKKGPPIHLEVIASAHHILQTKMRSSRSFCVTVSTKIAPDLLELLVSWLVDYTAGHGPEHPLPLNLESLTDYQQKVLLEMSQIPFGETFTYKELAEKCGDENAARAVGSCCRINPIPLIIPCHRVILSSGDIGEFAFGSDIKEQLIQFEKEHKKTTQVLTNMSGSLL